VRRRGAVARMTESGETAVPRLAERSEVPGVVVRAPSSDTGRVQELPAAAPRALRDAIERKLSP
jgi:hypothetical protein